MTADEFERAYCERSGMTVEAMHAHGRRARPCLCDYTGCDGWQMISDGMTRWRPSTTLSLGTINPVRGATDPASVTGAMTVPSGSATPTDSERITARYDARLDLQCRGALRSHAVPAVWHLYGRNVPMTPHQPAPGGVPV